MEKGVEVKPKEFKNNFKRYLHEPIFIKPSCDRVIICGPPGAGKSKYVNEHSKENDLIIDLDEIKAEVTGTGLYERQDQEAAEQALKERNRILRTLQDRENEIGTVWFIISGAYRSEREWWARHLGGKVVVIETDIVKCIKRIKADQRRPGYAKDKHIKAAYEWWEKYIQG